MRRHTEACRFQAFFRCASACRPRRPCAAGTGSSERAAKKRENQRKRVTTKVSGFRVRGSGNTWRFALCNCSGASVPCSGLGRGRRTRRRQRIARESAARLGRARLPPSRTPVSCRSSRAAHREVRPPTQDQALHLSTPLVYRNRRRNRPLAADAWLKRIVWVTTSPTPLLPS